MRIQAWLPDGTLVQDQEIIESGGLYAFYDYITGESRPATLEEIEFLPDPDILRAEELLATSPAVITMPKMWELMRIFGKLLGIHA